MNISQRIKNMGGLAAALMAVFLLVDKIDVPDSVEPATVAAVVSGDDKGREYVDTELAPVKASAKNSDLNWAIRNISWGLKERCTPNIKDSYEQYIDDYLYGNAAKNIVGQFVLYEQAAGKQHAAQAGIPICNREGD
jgi:hypothetical protein